MDEDGQYVSNFDEYISIRVVSDGNEQNIERCDISMLNSVNEKIPSF